ncbi:ABC transporter substrate binding protein [Kocuria rhizophila]|nr:ABC transporter substrate binding protein [Kocuria rhizophila]
MPTDNKVVAGLEAVISAAEARALASSRAREDSVERGALAARAGLEDLGKQTGEMAVKILKDGAKPGGRWPWSPRRRPSSSSTPRPPRPSVEIRRACGTRPTRSSSRTGDCWNRTRADLRGGGR